MALLRSQEAHYDADHVLVLAQTYHFEAAMIFLYEKAHLYQQIIQHYMDANDRTQLLAAAKKYGRQDPSIWAHVLSYFASLNEDCRSEIAEVLAIIEKNNLLPPLGVIQTLGKSSTVTLETVKGYIARRLQYEQQQITDDMHQIQQYREGTRRNREEIVKLRTTPKVFQVNKCSSCSSPLDLPSVHFLCDHAYHQSCLGDSERECPKCAPAFNQLRDRLMAQEASAGQHEQFFKELEGATDRFAVVASYFGHGLFNEHSLTFDPHSFAPSAASLGPRPAAADRATDRRRPLYSDAFL